MASRYPPTRRATPPVRSHPAGGLRRAARAIQRRAARPARTTGAPAEFTVRTSPVSRTEPRGSPGRPPCRPCPFPALPTPSPVKSPITCRPWGSAVTPVPPPAWATSSGASPSPRSCSAAGWTSCSWATSAGLPFVVAAAGGSRAALAPGAGDTPRTLADLAVDLAPRRGRAGRLPPRPRLRRALRARGLPVLALSDGDFGADQRATMYLDQNLGAVRSGAPDPAVLMLSGLRHVLLRDAVRRRRPADGPCTPRRPDGGSHDGAPRGARRVRRHRPVTPRCSARAPSCWRPERALDHCARSSPAGKVARAWQLPLGPAQGQTLLVAAVPTTSRPSSWSPTWWSAPRARRCGSCCASGRAAGDGLRHPTTRRPATARSSDRGLVAGLGTLVDLRDQEPARRPPSPRSATLLRDPDARDALAARGAGRGRRPGTRARGRRPRPPDRTPRPRMSPADGHRLSGRRTSFRGTGHPPRLCRPTTEAGEPCDVPASSSSPA